MMSMMIYVCSYICMALILDAHSDIRECLIGAHKCFYYVCVESDEGYVHDCYYRWILSRR